MGLIHCSEMIEGENTTVHKENMFTINLEDGREAPSKASINIKFHRFYHFEQLLR